MNQEFDNKISQNPSSEYAAALENLNNSLIWEFNNLCEEIRKPKRKLRLVISIVFFLYAIMFYVGAISFALIDFEEDKLTEDNTVEISATVSKIQPIPYRIQFTGYNSAFAVNVPDTIIDMDGLSRITAGQAVVLRIRKSDQKYTDRISDTVEIVALKADSEIITLSSYNEYLVNGNAGPIPIVVFLILGTCLMMPAIILLTSYIRKRPNRQHPFQK